MASQAKRPAWWHRDKKESLEQRIKAVQDINDPTTSADEILKGSKRFLWVLLVFTGGLAGLSYFKFFSHSFPIEIALVFAVAITGVIEWGKNYCTLRAVRIPFFHGWSHIRDTRENSVIWVGVTLVALITFTVSIFNSTAGSEHLSLVLGQEKNESNFNPETADIDSLITSTQKNIDEASKTKWRGTTTRTSQESIKSYSASIVSLNKQREDRIAQQRADWEKSEANKSSNNVFASKWVMYSGGWVEALQILLIFIRVACERYLDKLRSDSPTEEKQPIGFRPATSGYRAVGAESTTQPPSAETEPRRPIGYGRYGPAAAPEQSTVPPVPPQTVPAKNTVEQCSTQEQSVVQVRTVHTQDSVLADVSNWKKRAQQCYDRSIHQQRPEYKQDNHQRYMCYSIMLQCVGVAVQQEGDKLIFTDPDRYTINDDVVSVITEQQDRLARIGQRRVGA